MKVAIQGEFGSFSHEAAIQMEPRAEVLPCPFSKEVFEKVTSGEAIAVIPIENSLAGSVVEHYDLLFQSDVRIEAEFLLRIRHNLIGIRGSGLGDLRRAYSHPVALAQCRRFFAEHPGILPEPAYDTAGSVKKVMEAGDRSNAAIASRQAAEFYGGEILAVGIEDNPANFTRFLRVRAGRDRMAMPSNPPPDKLSLAFIVENRPGTLVSALDVFRDCRANLSKIESRPVHGQPWDYVFYADCRLTTPEDADAILDGLSKRCLAVKELGLYRAASNY